MAERNKSIDLEYAQSHTDMGVEPMENIQDIRPYILALFQKAQISCSNEQVNKLQRYLELLLEWNRKINLTAITEPKQVAVKHFLDSALLLQHIGEIRENCDTHAGNVDTGAVNSIKTESISGNDTIGKISKEVDASGLRVIDVGTGAGFPGLVLKILVPSLKVTLLDSLGKRVDWLNEVAARLGLDGVEAIHARAVCHELKIEAETIHARAEEAGRNPELRCEFDIATARAVAPLNLLTEYCMPFVKMGGSFFAMKGPSGGQELEEARYAIGQLGGRILCSEEYELPGGDKRSLLEIRRVKPLSEVYPRPTAKIKKKPL